jgi:hypothetical protein
MKTLPAYESITPEFKVEKTSGGQPYLSMNYEPCSFQSKVFDGSNTFTFHLRRDIPFTEVYALQEMLEKYVEEVSVQDEKSPGMLICNLTACSLHCGRRFR